MDQLATMQEGQDFERLQHLLNKPNTHCQFLLKRQREKETKRQENKEITDATKQQQVRKKKEKDQEATF